MENVETKISAEEAISSKPILPQIWKAQKLKLLCPSEIGGKTKAPTKGLVENL